MYTVYEMRGANYQPMTTSDFGDIGLSCLKSTAKNLHENAGRETYIVGIDYETKEEHLVWHWALGDVPHAERFIKPENLAGNM